MMKRSSSPVAVLGAVGLCLASAGCGESREKVYSQGWNEGYREGLAEGRKEGAVRAEANHQGKWGLIGLAIGGALGAAVVALATRKHLADQWQRRRRRKEVERFIGTCRVDLDSELHAEVMGIARKKASLVDRLDHDDGPLIAALHDRLRPEFVRLDTRLLELAALLQQLRDLRRETVTGAAARARVCPSGSGETELPESAALRGLEERRRNELRKNSANIERCESQLAGLATFLDELHMRLGNLKTIEQADAFERFEKDAGEEIDALASVFASTLASLSQGR
jgi:hypothetical protein